MRFFIERILKDTKSSWLIAVALLTWHACASEAPGCHGDHCMLRDTELEAEGLQVEMLQVDQHVSRQSRQMVHDSTGANSEINMTDGCDGGDLAFFHVPYNFGRTVEKVALLGPGHKGDPYHQLSPVPEAPAVTAEDTPKPIPGGQLWGLHHPKLTEKNDVTGCQHGYTPPKYWSKSLRDEYFGDKHSFGILRDPYERLVAMFRGFLIPSILGSEGIALLNSCDVNTAVKRVVKGLIDGTVDKFVANCQLLPQAEYFGGEHGVSIAVDNRRFPDSYNELLKEHGYDQIFVSKEDIVHVSSCPEVWSANLDCETRALVQQYYAKDFDLVCSELGHCDKTENCCITGVEGMCPQDISQTHTKC